MKTCSKCRVEKPYTEFNKAKKERDGYQYTCRACNTQYREANSEKVKSYNQAYWEQNKEQLLQQNAARREQNKDRYNAARNARRASDEQVANLHRAKNLIRYYEKRDEIKAQQKEYRGANKEYLYQANKKWRSDNWYKVRAYRLANVAKLRAKSAKRAADRIRATPKWADLEAIRLVYETCELINNMTGKVHHVDHIIPLRNRLVCGLHVPYNLQILTAEENLRKGNTFQL